jgi:hypothetical protein
MYFVNLFLIMLIKSHNQIWHIFAKPIIHIN